MSWECLRRTLPSHLFKFEDVFVEVMLQLLIGIVNAELFKGVHLKHFEAKYVQHSYRVSLQGGPQLHQQQKQSHQIHQQVEKGFMLNKNMSEWRKWYTILNIKGQGEREREREGGLVEQISKWGSLESKVFQSILGCPHGYWHAAVKH